MLTIACDQYTEWLFDMDGVLVDSNSIKRRNIERAALFAGEEYARRFVAYFIANNGVPRETKIARWFEGSQRHEVLNRYNALNAASLMQTSLLPGVEILLKELSNRSVRVEVYTGGDRAESVELLRRKEILRYVDHVHGGPETKVVNFDKSAHQLPIVYFGDSLADYEFATAREFDFIFVWGASQFEAWRKFFSERRIFGQIRDLSEIRLV